MKTFEFTDKEIEELVGVLRDNTVDLELSGDLHEERYGLNRSLLKKLGCEYVEGEIRLNDPDPLEKTYCIKCGCTFDEAAYNRGGIIHDSDAMKHDEWICEKCDDPEVFEFKQKAMKLLRDNKVFLNCPVCGKKMITMFSYQCRCGIEK